mgnify:CR=1 FL=1
MRTLSIRCERSLAGEAELDLIQPNDEVDHARNVRITIPNLNATSLVNAVTHGNGGGTLDQGLS